MKFRAHISGAFLILSLLLPTAPSAQAHRPGLPGPCPEAYQHLLPLSPEEVREELLELYPRFLRLARAKRVQSPERRRALAEEVLRLTHQHLDYEGVEHTIRETEGRRWIEISPGQQTLFNRAARGVRKYDAETTIVFDPEQLLTVKATALFLWATNRINTSFLSILRASPNEPTFKHEIRHALTTRDHRRGRPSIFASFSNALEIDGRLTDLPGPPFRSYAKYMQWDELLAHEVSVRETYREYTAWLAEGRPASGQEVVGQLKRALRIARRVHRRGLAISSQLTEALSALARDRPFIPLGKEPELKIPLLAGERWRVRMAAEKIETEYGAPVVEVLLQLAPAARGPENARARGYENVISLPASVIRDGAVPIGPILEQLSLVSAKAEENLRRFRTIRIRPE